MNWSSTLSAYAALDLGGGGDGDAEVPQQRVRGPPPGGHGAVDAGVLAVVAGDQPDTVLLLEHPSVFTAGKRTEPADRPFDGTPVVDVDRGGKITWHGPGQLVGYPILKLADPIDVVAYVRRVEQLLGDQDLTARRPA